MTPEEMRIAIAEKCGWRFHDGVYTIKNGSACDGKKWITPNGSWVCSPWFETRLVATEFAMRRMEPLLPDFPNDLNAMHEAEKMLPWDKKDVYRHTLQKITPTGLDTDDDIFNLLHATAAQRAEAFCRVLWPEKFQ